MLTRNPIIVVTGANGGVGFGICHRLLFQLSQRSPSDAQPVFASGDEVVEPCDSLTLIMACRSLKRAEGARTKLLQLLDGHVVKLQHMPGDNGHAQRFRQNLRIEVHYLDLASVSTVFRFGAELRQKYPYISHLICNAGLASFTGISWPLAIRRLMTGLVNAVTYPDYYLQNRGEMSIDGLGWVWQCNVFGHYCLFRGLEALLTKSPESARVLWMSSLEGSPQYYDAEDWQLVKTEHSYQASKYQMDLIATALDRRALKSRASSNLARHFIVHPAVTDTNVSAALAAGFLNIFKVLSFYIARLLGSPNHPITTYKAAISAVHVSLVSLAFLPTVLFFKGDAGRMTTLVTSNGPAPTDPASKPSPVKYGSQTDWRGHERVGVTPVIEWEEHEAEAFSLVDKCETLYNSLHDAEGKVSFEQASERM